MTRSFSRKDSAKEGGGLVKVALHNADQHLLAAARRGDAPGVLEALAAGAHANNDLALRSAALRGHLEVVRCLLAVGADIHGLGDSALRWAAIEGHVEVVRVLIEHGAYVRPIKLKEFGGYTPSAQVAIIEAGDIDGLNATDLAGSGACPEVVCILLERQGHVDLATMLTATQMLEPLAPDARAELLENILAQRTQSASTHAGPG